MDSVDREANNEDGFWSYLTSSQKKMFMGENTHIIVCRTTAFYTYPYSASVEMNLFGRLSPPVQQTCRELEVVQMGFRGGRGRKRLMREEGKRSCPLIRLTNWMVGRGKYIMIVPALIDASVIKSTV